MGLARALSKLGHCSRSQGSILIRDGKVRLNGRVRRDPEAPVRLGSDKIEVAGQSIEAQDFVYLAMNKPRGLVTTASDEKGRETVYTLLSENLGENPNEIKDLPWVAPVGRLDRASEGLLLLTNDSEWGARIAAPDSYLAKIYHVQTSHCDPPALAQSLATGVESRGELLRAEKITVLRQGRRNAWLEITLHEGKNRHIRRMMEACGAEVLRLVRIAIGPLTLGTLAKGKVRPLSGREKSGLDAAMANRVTPRSRNAFTTLPL